MTTRRLRVVLAIATMAVAGVGLQPLAAHAATLGPGYDYHGDPHSHLGGYLDPDGTVSYCIDAGIASPVGGVTTDRGVVDQVHGLPDEAMQRLSYVLARHGNTRDGDVAAAVALVVWGLADAAHHAARGGDGFVITRAPADRRAKIRALADQYRDEAARYEPPVAGTAQLGITATAGDPLHPVLEVTLTPGSATGSVSLTNAVFADSGSATRDGVADGDRLPIEAVQPAGVYEWAVEASGEFSTPGYPDGSVHLYTTPGAQSITASGRQVPLVIAGAGTAKIALPRPAAASTLPRVAG